MKDAVDHIRSTHLAMLLLCFACFASLLTFDLDIDRVRAEMIRISRSSENYEPDWFRAELAGGPTDTSSVIRWQVELELGLARERILLSYEGPGFYVRRPVRRTRRYLGDMRALEDGGSVRVLDGLVHEDQYADTIVRRVSPEKLSTLAEFRRFWDSLGFEVAAGSVDTIVAAKSPVNLLLLRRRISLGGARTRGEPGVEFAQPRLFGMSVGYRVSVRNGVTLSSAPPMTPITVKLMACSGAEIAALLRNEKGRRFALLDERTYLVGVARHNPDRLLRTNSDRDSMRTVLTAWRDCTVADLAPSDPMSPWEKGNDSTLAIELEALQSADPDDELLAFIIPAGDSLVTIDLRQRFRSGRSEIEDVEFALACPNIAGLGDAWHELKIKDAHHLLREVARNQQDVKPFGVSIPPTGISLWGALVICATQVYLLCYLRLNRLSVTVAGKPGYGLWLGFSPDALTRSMMVGSCTILPIGTIVFLIYWQITKSPGSPVLYILPVLLFASAIVAFKTWFEIELNCDVQGTRTDERRPPRAGDEDKE